MNLGRDFTIGDSTYSPDRREIVFDRVGEESDFVLFDLPARESAGCPSFVSRRDVRVVEGARLERDAGGRR